MVWFDRKVQCGGILRGHWPSLYLHRQANFLEIDVFVLVAAAEYSLLLDSDADGEKFVKPIATPFELEVRRPATWFVGCVATRSSTTGAWGGTGRCVLVDAGGLEPRDGLER